MAGILERIRRRHPPRGRVALDHTVRELAGEIVQVNLGSYRIARCEMERGARVRVRIGVRVGARAQEEVDDEEKEGEEEDEEGEGPEEGAAHSGE